MHLRDGEEHNNNDGKDIYSLYVEMNGISNSNENSETEPLVNETFDESSVGGSSKRQMASLEIMSVDVDEDSPITQDADEGSKLVNVEVPQCRICLDTGGEDLIAPCYCKGTQKYVHRTCLDNWRSTKEGFAFAHCTECRAVFILRANVPADRWWLRIKFKFLVIRDHAFLFIIVQLVVASLGLLVYRFYGDKMREMFDYEEHPYGFYSMAVIAIMLVGLLYGFFIAIIFGQRINERHYHVLEKQELTKEYIVENRDENTNPSELNSGHVMELRMMGLY